MIRVELLGGVRLLVGEQVVTRFQTRKVAALLAYLAHYREREHPRETLIDLLWPESDLVAGRKSLSVALSALRKELEPAGAPVERILRTDHFAVQLDPSVVTTDAGDFEALVEQARDAGDPSERARVLEQAAGLYSGDLLPGFYEEWVASEQDRLRDLASRVFSALVSLRAAAGDVTDAIAWARRAVAANPLHEEAHRELMRLYAGIGQGARALQHYQELVELLERQVDSPPSPETQALAAELREAAQAPRGGAVPVARPAEETPQRGAPTRLPREVTRFVGRQRELEQLRALLGDARLVTLTGAGGIGKTRLAVEVASTHDGPVRFVELAALLDPSLVPGAVLRALGGREEHPDVIETLVHHLETGELLLVLDNCEQVVDACARLSGVLLRRCPGLRVLATSREVLGLDGEVLFRVPPLGLPEGAPLSLEEAEQAEAVRFFSERARLHRPDFALTAENAGAVVELCRKLDGIPLALELAAARLRHLPVEEIAARLDDRFALLTSGSRAALPRHQTLRALIDWSYDHLTPDEQALFRRLGVFAGGWALEAAEQVCAPPDLAPEQVLDLVGRLVDKSLVLWKERGGARYRLLETLRQYAADKLVEDEEEAARTARRHAEYFLEFARERDARKNTPEEAVAWADLDWELDNLRAAMQWAGTHDDRLYVEFVKVLYAFFWRRGYWRERLDTSLRGLEAARRAFGESHDEVARMLHSAGFAYQEQGDYEEARVCYAAALEIARQVGNQSGIAAGLNNLGNIALDVGDQPEAERRYSEGLELLRAAGKWADVAVALNNLGQATAARDDLERAQSLYEESLRLARETGNERAAGLVLNSLGSLARRRGDLAAAEAHFHESLSANRRLGNKRQMGHDLHGLGDIAQARRDWHTARRYYEEALRVRVELGHRLGAAETLGDLAEVLAEAGDPERAAVLLHGAVRLLERLGSAQLPSVREAEERLRRRSGAPDDTWNGWLRRAEAIRDPRGFLELVGESERPREAA